MNCIDDFSEIKECDYKGEHYCVRDNGAVLRHAQAGKKPRKLDNIWTFGKVNLQNGYLHIGSARVHRIVALAFHGEPPTKEHITDHIDTNRQNNRPQNLRYLTRLENALLNPITRSKIEYYCGSIRAFLENPSMLRERAKNSGDKNIEWMRSVSAEEAQHCLINLQHLSAHKNDSHKNFAFNGYVHSRKERKMGEWIYKPMKFWQATPTNENLAGYDTQALSPSNATQRDWRTPTEFPLCPKESSQTPLEDYCNNLQKEALFSQNKNNVASVLDFALCGDKKSLFVDLRQER